MGTVFPRQSDNMKLLQFLLLLLWPLLSLKPRLTLLYSTEPTDMASPTPVSTVATEPMEPTPIPMATTARGLLMLTLRLTPLSSTEPMDTPMPVSTDTDTVATEPMEPTPIAMATTARGPLMLSLRPRLTPLSSTEQSISSTEPTDMAFPTLVSTDTEPLEPTPPPTTEIGLSPPLLSRLSSTTLVNIHD